MVAETGGSGAEPLRGRPRARPRRSEAAGALGLMSSTLLTEKTASFSAALVVGGEAESLFSALFSSTVVSVCRSLERPPPRFRLRLVSLHIVEWRGLDFGERRFSLEGNDEGALDQGFINI